MHEPMKIRNTWQAVGADDADSHGTVEPAHGHQAQVKGATQRKRGKPAVDAEVPVDASQLAEQHMGERQHKAQSARKARAERRKTKSERSTIYSRAMQRAGISTPDVPSSVAEAEALSVDSNGDSPTPTPPAGGRTPLAANRHWDPDRVRRARDPAHKFKERKAYESTNALRMKRIDQEARCALFCPSQDILYPCFRGWQKYSWHPSKYPHDISPVKVHSANFAPPDASSRWRRCAR